MLQFDCLFRTKGIAAANTYRGQNRTDYGGDDVRDTDACCLYKQAAVET